MMSNYAPTTKGAGEDEQIMKEADAEAYIHYQMCKTDNQLWQMRQARHILWPLFDILCMKNQDE